MIKLSLQKHIIFTTATATMTTDMAISNQRRQRLQHRLPKCILQLQIGRSKSFVNLLHGWQQNRHGGVQHHGYRGHCDGGGVSGTGGSGGGGGYK